MIEPETGGPVGDRSVEPQVVLERHWRLRMDVVAALRGHHCPVPGELDRVLGDHVQPAAQGCAELEFADGRRERLTSGDWLLIPAGCRHRVAATGPDTVWLAIHLAG